MLPASAPAGGLMVSENGAAAMQRGGAFVARADDPTALSINPAGLMKARRFELYLGSNLAFYSLTYQRAGTYENQPDRGPQPGYVGTPYPEMKNESGPQPLPMLAGTYHFDGIPLAVGIGAFAPPSVPNRDFSCTVDENCIVRPDGAPAPQRYDVINQEAIILLPSVAVAYRILPELDVGARFAVGFGRIKARSFTWGALTGNPEEDPSKDGDFSVNVTDNFIPQAQLGVLYRPTAFLELGAEWTSGITIDGQGTGEARLGENVSPIPGTTPMLVPVADAEAVCAPGGSASALKSCVKVKLPMHAQLGVRYIFRDEAGGEKADVELDLRWENWSAASDTEVVVDGQDSLIGLKLNKVIIRHGYRDVFSMRLGGSYQLPVGENRLHLRAGVAIDTAAAPVSWTRADQDGVAQFLLALGAGYELSWLRIDLGVGLVFQPTRTVTDVPNPGNPDDRQQPDPKQPAFPDELRAYSPFNAGTYDSSYLLASLGFTAKF
jgi:long-chain fatty acid transport protein